MAINKNFVVKNGIEVNTNLIVADTDSNKVGIGTTIPAYTLHVFQGTGIGASSVYVTGISTVAQEFNVGLGGSIFTVLGNAEGTAGIGQSVGVGTGEPAYLLDVRAPVSTGQTALYVQGDVRITGDINIDDITINDLIVSGISTFQDDIFIGTGATVGFGSTAFFKDYAKAIFGNGEDLKVYHDGSNSYISDTGTGGLIVGSNLLTVKNAALNETQAVFTENGSVELYHDNGKRFETNAIGVEVSGTFESTGITTLASDAGITTTGGDLYVGGDLYINEDVVLDTNLNILGIATIGSIHITGISTFDGEIRGPNLTNSVLIGTGLSVRGATTGVAVTLAGAGGITTTGGDFYVGGDLYINEDVILDTNLTILGIATIGVLQVSNTSGINTIFSTVQSSSKDTGALVIEGGVGIEKNLFVGGGAEITGITSIDGVLNAKNTTQATSPTSGSLATLGGLAVVKNAYIGGGAEITGLTTITGVLDANNTTQSSSSTTGAAQFAGGVGVAKNLFVGGGAEITGLTTITGVLNANNTTQATSPTSGSLATLGGLAVVKNAYIGGGQVTVGIHTITDLRVGTQLAGQTLVGITTILDEDSFASNSAAALATQQSIKAYVDATTTASDLDFQGDSGGAQSVDLDSQTFTIAGTSNEIETSGSGQTLTVGLPNDVTIGNDLTVTNIVSVASSVFHTGDLNSAFGFPAADTFTVYTGGSERLRVDSSGRTTAGGESATTSGPQYSRLQVLGNTFAETTGLFSLRRNEVFGDITAGEDLGVIHFADRTGNTFAEIHGTCDGTTGSSDYPGRLAFYTTADGASSATEKVRIDKDGKILAGHTADISGGGLQVSGSANAGNAGFHRFDANDSGPFIQLLKSRNGTVGSNTVVQSGDELGTINFQGADGTDFHSGARIVAKVDSTPGDGDMPGRLEFHTTVDGSGTPTEKVRITNAGHLSIVGDNQKILVGAGDDLEIIHDGTDTIIDNNTGDLLIRNTGDDIIIRAADDVLIQTQASEGAIVARGDGTVELYHNNNLRVATTDDGADFSGTASIKIPVGTTAQRNGSPVNGDIRYNTDLNSYEGYGNGAWGGLGGGTEIDVSVSSTSATNLTTFAHASYRSASFRVQITQGTSYQVGKYMLIHDGTTVTMVEESAIATGSMLGDITSVINGSNVEIKVTMYSASSATVTTIIDKITV